MNTTVHAAQYFAAKDLHWQKDASGARFWSVDLLDVQLTGFIVPAGARFDRHHHHNEQITMVLEGELIFELDDETRHVGAGDVIALPSNVPHAVIAGPAGARAIDAWSPPIATYAESTP